MINYRVLNKVMFLYSFLVLIEFYRSSYNVVVNLSDSTSFAPCRLARWFKSSRKETLLDLIFVLFAIYHQGVAVFLIEVILPVGFELISFIRTFL